MSELCSKCRRKEGGVAIAQETHAVRLDCDHGNRRRCTDVIHLGSSACDSDLISLLLLCTPHLETKLGIVVLVLMSVQSIVKHCPRDAAAVHRNTGVRLQGSVDGCPTHEGAPIESNA